MTELQFDVVDLEAPRTYFAGLTKQTLAHAYLFTGASGVGKKTFARALAQSVLCQAPKEHVLGYDGTCSSCRLFAGAQGARHPDFLEHEGALKIGSSDTPSGFGAEDLTARDLVRQLSMQSYSGGMRVLLLGDVEFATHHAANALLKFLEEPPAGVLLLLTTSAPGRLLTTIRSRLIELRFPLLAKPAIVQILRRMGYSDDDAALGATLGGGSVTRAAAALEGESESLRAQVARWFFEAAAGRSPEAGWATRETLDEGLETIKALARDWVVRSERLDAAATAAPDYAGDVERLRPLERREAIELLAKLDDAARLARTNVSAAMVSELVRMALPTGSGSGGPRK